MDEGERRWLLKAIRESGGEIEAQIVALDSEVLRWRATDDDWCLLELMGHLADAERLYVDRLRRILSDFEPNLRDIDIESWPRERDYASGSVRAFARVFALERSETVMLLWSAGPSEWERGGEHPFRGRLTLGDVARDINRHDLEHLWQARRLVRHYEDASGLPSGSILE